MLWYLLSITPYHLLFSSSKHSFLQGRIYFASHYPLKCNNNSLLNQWSIQFLFLFLTMSKNVLFSPTFSSASSFILSVQLFFQAFSRSTFQRLRVSSHIPSLVSTSLLHNPMLHTKYLTTLFPTVTIIIYATVVSTNGLLKHCS